MLSDQQLNNLFRYAVSLCGDQNDACDLVQTTIEKCLRAAKIPGTSLQPAFYYKTLRNTYFDIRKSAAVRQHEDLQDEVVDISSRNLDDILIDRTEAESVLAMLEPLERELIYLHLVEEMTIDELAAATERPRGTLLSAVFRIKKKIRKHFSAPAGLGGSR
jgi:RNA polymerase sigma-70 factor, ECF subfamily